MYTNETNNRFSFRDVVLQFLFVALFIFILLWLFPMKSDFKKLEKSVDKLSDNSLKLSSESTGELNLFVLYDRIFNENVIAMKDAAKSYYTTSRLPQKVGESTKMTLGEMLSKKIILPFVDKNGKTCDTKASYVEITKYNDEFVMKVNLKCGEEENYLLVYMGCYDYCQTAICEKNKTDIKKPVVHQTVSKPTPKPTSKPTTKVYGTPSCTLAVESGTLGNDGYYKTDVVVKFKSTSAGVNTSLSGYGLGTSTNYNGNKTYKVTKDGTTTVYGYVKNTAGKTATCSIVIKKKIEQEKPVIVNPTCELKVASGTLGNNGIYKSNVVVEFKSKTANTKGATIVGYGLGTSLNYNNNNQYTVTKDGTTTVYGYVKDSNGNVGSCNITVTKEHELTCVWTDWSAWTKNPISETPTRQVRTQTVLDGYNTVVKPDTTKPIFETRKVVIGTTTTKSCASYTYSGTITTSSWKSAGTVKLTSSPTQTKFVKYVLVGEYNWYCTSSSNCTAGTVFVYEKYIKTITKSTGTYKCSKYVTDTAVTVANKTVLTGYQNKEEKTPIYKTEYAYRDLYCY